MTMTIDHAIQRNVELKGELLREGRIEKAEAVKLGLEALEEVKRLRSYKAFHIVKTLPGETTD